MPDDGPAWQERGYPAPQGEARSDERRRVRRPCREAQREGAVAQEDGTPSRPYAPVEFHPRPVTEAPPTVKIDGGNER